jgi:putative two-component system response regulator
MDSAQGVYPLATVLVVDDTPDNLMLIAELLKDKYRVKAANSGEKALRLLQADPLPDLILLDIMMPGLSGYDVAEQLKFDPRIRHIPIIFLTAMTATEDEIRGLSLGAADYITKPIIPPILMARVETQIKLKAVADFLRSSTTRPECSPSSAISVENGPANSAKR